MSSSLLKATFYGFAFLTFICFAIFVFKDFIFSESSYDETALGYENKRLPKRQERNEKENQLPYEKRRGQSRRTENDVGYKTQYLDDGSTNPQKVVILYWSTTFGRVPSVNFNPDAWPFFFAGQNCPIKCELTTDKRRVHEASALVVHSRNINELPPKTYKNLTWILHTNENPIYTSSLRDPGIMGQFNYYASYRLDSDFPCPEFVKPNLEPPVPFSEKKGFVIVVTSNCEPIRTHYIAELMKYIKIDSYGACLRNKHGLVGKEKMHSRHAVTELRRNYKFSLIFPNADCDYYMTEKIYSALSAGSVPVWLGTDGIDEVLKWGNLNHSVIKVNDFSSPKALAEYLRRLAQDEQEYNQYLKWKYEGFQFPKEYYASPIGQWWDGLPLYCRVCMRIMQDPHGHNGLPVDRCDGEQTRTAEKWLNNTESTAMSRVAKISGNHSVLAFS